MPGTSQHPCPNVRGCVDSVEAVRESVIAALEAQGMPRGLLEQRVTHNWLVTWGCEPFQTACSALHDAEQNYRRQN